MRFVSWNVNGLRAVYNKNFMQVFASLDADFFCLQETKLQAGQISLKLDGYFDFWNYAQKKGYSGTAIFTKHPPINATYGINKADFDTEGRVITLEYKDFYLVTVYTPNSQEGLKRIDFRVGFEDAFRDYLAMLAQKKGVIICGDMNVARSEIDLKYPKANEGKAGYSVQERGKMQQLLDSGFIDTFRHFYPQKKDAYTWWSYRFNARANNAGWRIDYFLVSVGLASKIKDSIIHSDIMGSDHCPVELVTSD